MKRAKVQLLAVLGLGALLGYVAAAGPSRLGGWFQPAASGRGAETDTPQGKEQPGCCDGLGKGELLAMADPNVKAASARVQKDSGKKPNILFIMGDDVGWFNIGA